MKCGSRRNCRSSTFDSTKKTNNATAVIVTRVDMGEASRFVLVVFNSEAGSLLAICDLLREVVGTFGRISLRGCLVADMHMT